MAYEDASSIISRWTMVASGLVCVVILFLKYAALPLIHYVEEDPVDDDLQALAAEAREKEEAHFRKLLASQHPPVRLALPGKGKARHFAIYTVTTKDGKTLQIHGANRLPYSVALASDTDWNPEDGFSPDVTFTVIYPKGIERISRWSGQGGIIPTLGGLYTVAGYSYTGLPPRLPIDRGVAEVDISELPKGHDALFLRFGTRPTNSSILIVANYTKD